MSQPKRYEVLITPTKKGISVDMTEIEIGHYVLYSDYAALAAENERLKEPWVKILTESETWKALSEVARLTAENERLRKAGDAMYHTAQQDGTGLWLHKSFQDWNAAKEGGAK